MSEKEELLKQIIDDIEAGLIDDPVEDYKYLNAEAQKYENHELAEDIYKELARILYGDIPAMAQKGLKDGIYGDTDTFNLFVNEAEQLMFHGQWVAAANMLQSLIGDGVGLEDTDETEYRSLTEEIQYIFYQKFMQPEGKELHYCPVNLGKLYGLYGTALVEFGQIEAAVQMLELSLHFNPYDYRFAMEYAETFKIQGELDKYKELSEHLLEYAYRSVDIAHLYRNLGYICIENKDYETAIALYYYSLAYAPDNEGAKNELEYIAHEMGRPVKEPTPEAAEAALEKAGIQIGVSKTVYEVLYRNAYVESHLEHDVERTEYFCKLLLDVSQDEETFNELMEVAKDKSKGINIFGMNSGDEAEQTAEPSYYEIQRANSLKEVFPEFPNMDDCRLKISFTISGTKYADTILQILMHIDESSKLVEGKDVTVLFLDIKAVTENIRYINDLLAVAGGWKTFKLTINDVPRDKYEFRHFTEYLKDELKVDVPWGGSPEDILKTYKKESAPKRAKKLNIEDDYKVNIADCTPQEIVTGLAQTYTEVYLSEFEVRAIRVSDDEIVLVANDDFVVDFWVSPYGYGPTIDGVSDGSKPYEFCTYFIQELSRNNLFKYNAAAFGRIFTGLPFFTFQSLRFYGPDYYQPTVNRFYKIDKAYPELQLKAKYDAYQGEPCNFVILEMENADGSIGSAIGYTDKKTRALVVKICKELEKRTPSDLLGNCAPGLVFSLSESFVPAFLSWKGEKKTKRLEQHLKYFSIEKVIKEKDDGYDVSKEIMADYRAGKFNDVERNTYADLGRK